ncbi:MAG TPA: hypothetical protein VMT04_01810, partial [Terriglobales bacterium]|nr:hypothetical protein [Terriglobales bacterium]
MKKTLMFFLVLLFVSVQVSGKDSKGVSSKVEVDQSHKVPSLPCTQQRVHRESNLWFTITNWGFLGSEARNFEDSETGLPAPSADFPGGSDLEYMFLGALWVGGVVEGETLVSVGADGWIFNYELFPTTCPNGMITEIEDHGDQEFLAGYTDTLINTGSFDPYDNRPQKPLNVQVTQHSYSWVSPPYDNFVLLDYKVKNIGNKSISKAYIGFYMDTDILWISNPIGYLDDETGFIKSVEAPEGPRKFDVSWAADNDGDLVNGQPGPHSPLGVLGFKLMGSSNPAPNLSYNWWVSEGSDPVNLDFGPWKKSNWDLWTQNYGIWCEGGKGTPCGDRAKYFLMSNGEYDYDQIYSCIDQTDSGWLPPSSICTNLADGYDIKFLYSFGPFDIPAKDSIEFAVGVIMGDSLHKGLNPIDPQNPQTYYAKLDFDDLISNVFTAQKVFESGYTLPPPGPPKVFVLLNSTDSSLILSWSTKKYYNLKGYNLYRSSVSGEYPTSPVNTGVIKDTFFLDKGLTEGNTYYYVVTSVNEYGKEGKRSKELTILAGRPMPPTGLTATSAKDEICLAWKPHPDKDVIGYKIYRKEEGGIFALVGNVGFAGLDTSFCDKNIENGVVYYYAVSAVDDLGLESFLSDSVYALSMAFDQGILLVDMSSPYGIVFVQDDSVNTFYNRALQNYPYVYSKHDLPSLQYVSLKELSPYPVCIVYSEGRFGPTWLPGNSYDSTLTSLRRYLAAGGKLVLVGRHLVKPFNDNLLPMPNPLKKGEFGYDILHIAGMVFIPDWYWTCGQEEFIGTSSTIPYEFSDLDVDTSRVNRSYHKEWCDLQGRLPLMGYFVSSHPDEVIFNFNSVFDTSDFEGKPVGTRHIGQDYKIYFFDFPLYYIKESQSVPLLHKILDEFGFSPTLVGEEDAGKPEKYSLGSNYPNPFNLATTIPYRVGGSQFMVHGPSRTTLKIYNILGQLVRTLVDEEKAPGNY